jgi:3-oxoadipate enol-lactonase
MMAKATIDGAQFNYRFDGPQEAPVLVLSNSLGTNYDMWLPQMDAYASRYRVLRYDSRGHGQSAVTPGPYTIEQLGRDVIALLDALDIERAHFCGLSKGGMVGMWLGVNAPRRINRLVLCNTAAKIGTAEIWNARIDAVRRGGMAAVADTVVERWFTEGFRTRDPAAVARVRQMLLDTPPDGYAACCAAVRDMDQRATIAHISHPTLVIAGAHDGVTSPADTRPIAEAVPGARYVELDASHLSNVEQASRFTEAVLGFLDDQGI